jgi:hypothetical protein
MASAGMRSRRALGMLSQVASDGPRRQPDFAAAQLVAINGTSSPLEKPAGGPGKLLQVGCDTFRPAATHEMRDLATAIALEAVPPCLPRVERYASRKPIRPCSSSELESAMPENRPQLILAAVLSFIAGAGVGVAGTLVMKGLAGCAAGGRRTEWHRCVHQRAPRLPSAAR